MSSLRTLAIAALLSLPAVPALAQTTDRIETRAFYGATVTLEHGVRVIRPLPPHNRIIINPNNTPLNLSYEDVRAVSQHNYYDHTGGAAAAPASGGNAYGGYYDPRFGHGRHGHPNVGFKPVPGPAGGHGSGGHR